MYTLYARPGAGSASVEALLAECGVAHQVVDISRDSQKQADYLAINPRGEIPSLRLPDHSLMTESAAMMIYLADRHSSGKLAPSLDSPHRAHYLRWILNFASAIYMADLRMYYSVRYSTDATAAEGIKAKAIIDMDRDFEVFSEALGAGPFILGAEFSAADIYAAMLVSWAADVKALFAKHPNIAKLYAAVAARPKITPVWKRNDMLFA